MALIAMNTDNPLGQRPFGAMGGGLAGLASSDEVFCSEFPSECDVATMTPNIQPNERLSPQAAALLNQRPDVLDALATMGAITHADVGAIISGRESLTQMPVTMSMVNQALSIMDKPGVPVQYTIGNAGGPTTATTPPPSDPNDPCKSGLLPMSMTQWFECHAVLIGVGVAAVLATVLVIPALVRRS